MGLSNEEKVRIEEEEKHREKVRSDLQSKKLATGCLGCLGLIVVIALIGALTQSGSVPGNQQPTSEQPQQEQPTVVAPKPINLSGKGQQASSKFTLTKGLSVFKMTHTGSSNFAIFLLDDRGQKVALLVNEIGSFNGSKAEGIRSEGTYVLDVTASGAWTVKIEQPRPSSAPSTTSFSGTGQRATAAFNLSSGLKTFKMTHNGSSNWAPILLDKDGNMIELLANEIGRFNGSKAVGITRSGIYILDVTADGSWTIKIQ